MPVYYVKPGETAFVREGIEYGKIELIPAENPRKAYITYYGAGMSPRTESRDLDEGYDLPGEMIADGWQHVHTNARGAVAYIYLERGESPQPRPAHGRTFDGDWLTRYDRSLMREEVEYAEVFFDRASDQGTVTYYDTDTRQNRSEEFAGTEQVMRGLIEAGWKQSWGDQNADGGVFYFERVRGLEP
jgi:hypothetical protein